MKKTLIYLIALMSVMILWGCPSQTPEEDPVLRPNQTTFNIGAEGGEISVDFSTNVAFSVKPEAGADWLTVVTRSKAVESKSVTIKASANTSVESRKANVVIDGGKVNATVQIVQAGVTPRIDIATVSYPVSADGGTISVDVDSNVEYEVKVGADWIESKGKNMGIEVFEVVANPGESDRSATVTFSYGSLSKTISVTQNGKEKEEEPYINIGTTSYNVPAAGGSVNVSVSSNVSYQVSIIGDWVSGSGNSYTVAENKTESERTATITYSYGNISKEVTIKQAAAEVNPVEEDVLENGGSPTYTVVAAGEQIEVTVRSNVDYKVEISADWIVQTKASSVREDKLTFTVSANEGAAREATITFKFEDMSFGVTVRQNAYVAPVEDPVLEVTPTELQVPAEGGEVSLRVNANYDYTIDCESDWIAVTSSGGTVSLSVQPNPEAKARTAMMIFNSEGLQAFVTVIQAAAINEEDPFDVGSNLSVNGTANSYVVTKAGTYTFDVSVMGNGEAGFLWDDTYAETARLWPQRKAAVSFRDASYTTRTKPYKVWVIWDEGNVIAPESVSLDRTSLTVSFTATGNKGNALIGVYDYYAEGKDSDVIWSWHIWCTDAPSHMTQYDTADQEYILLDRNLGATSASPADGTATYGLWYQFGRKDPLRMYPGIARDREACPEEMREAVFHPTFFFDFGSKTNEWYNNGTALSRFTADLWGNPRHLFATYETPGFDMHVNSASLEELKKTIYDPCPPGYMVPPETTWNALVPEEMTVLDSGVLVPTASGDSFYPFAGYGAGLNGDEIGDEANMGWFGYNGYVRRHKREVRRFAGVYTSCTGYCAGGDDYSRWTCYGAKFFNLQLFYDDTELQRDLEGNHIRQYARPVRCMKMPK